MEKFNRTELYTRLIVPPLVFISRTLRKIAKLSPVIVAIVTTVFLYSCEKTGIVGPNLVPSNATVSIDTIPLNKFVPSNIDMFSGRLTNFSAGMYNDKLFGDLKATGLIEPSLLDSGLVDTITPNTKMFLRFNISSVYGDTNSTINFDLVEASRRWRGNSWRLDSIPPASNHVITSFSVSNTDSFDVVLPQSFVTKYRSYYYDSTAVRDSLFNEGIPGFILQPTSSGKIVSFTGSNVRLIIQTGVDTSVTYTQTWAYSLQRTGEPQQPDSLMPIYSTFERVPSAKITVNTDSTIQINNTNINTKALSRVQLVLYKDTTAMQNSLPAGNARPPVTYIDTYYMENDQLVFDVLKGPINNANIDSTDGSFRVDLTGNIDDILLGKSNPGDFYFLPQLNDGTIHSLLIYTNKAKKRYPKLIITSVKQ